MTQISEVALQSLTIRSNNDMIIDFQLTVNSNENVHLSNMKKKIDNAFAFLLVFLKLLNYGCLLITKVLLLLPVTMIQPLK